LSRGEREIRNRRFPFSTSPKPWGGKDHFFTSFLKGMRFELEGKKEGKEEEKKEDRAPDCPTNYPVVPYISVKGKGGGEEREGAGERFF